MLHTKKKVIQNLTWQHDSKAATSKDSNKIENFLFF